MKVATTLRLPEELKKELEKEAQAQYMSFNSYILYLIKLARCR